MNLTDLPDDILTNILIKIEPSALYKISKTSKHMYNIIYNIVFKKILIINSKPMSQYNHNTKLNFFVYLFDSYMLGNVDNVGIPFEDNSKTYVIAHINSNYIAHNVLEKNGAYVFTHKGIETLDTNNHSNDKPYPIVTRKLNTHMAFSR